MKRDSEVIMRAVQATVMEKFGALSPQAGWIAHLKRQARELKHLLDAARSFRANVGAEFGESRLFDCNVRELDDAIERAEHVYE